MNIRVDLSYPIKDGTEVVFRSPVDCSQVTGLIVYYQDASKEFAFADAHGNNVGDIDHLFAENAVVKVILDVTSSMAFVQNADTNAYLEGRFAKVSVDDSKLGSNPWSSKNIVDKLCPAFTESGAIVTCEPVEGYPLGVVSQIVPVQEGSGDPHPGSHVGVNIDGIKNNANWTAEDRDDHYEYHYFLNVALSPGTYTAKYKASEREDFDFIDIMIEGCENLATSLYPGDDITITQDAVNNISKILVGIYAPQKLPDNIALYGDVLQVFELAEVKEPNIRPIVGYTDVKLTRCGKNLVLYPYTETTKTLNGLTFTDNGDGSITINGTATASTTFNLANYTVWNVKAGANYTASFKKVSGNVKSGDPSFVINYYPVGVSEYWPWLTVTLGATNTKTCPNGITSMRSYIYVPAGTVCTELVVTVQLEPGTVATAHVPYKESSAFTLDLGQTVYGGTYNWKTGELTITHGFYTMTGQETFSLYNNFFIAYNDGAFKASVANEGLCSHGSYANYRTGCWCVNGAVIYVPNGNYGLDNTGLQVFQEDIATWYELGYPVQLCYKLAQPITIQATPQEVLALQGVNTLFSNTGDTTVTGRADTLALIKKLQNSIAAVETALANNT